MQDALAIHRRLLAYQVHHEIVRLPRALTCSQDLPHVLGAPARSCIEVTVYEVTTRLGREPVAVISSVDRPPRPTMIAGVLDALSVKPASADLINRATDSAAGLVCPLLLPDELTVLIDQRLVDALEPDELVYTATGERRTALRLRVIHLVALASGKPVELAGHGMTG